jgi:DNA helicase-2/ATP-dependent DNA helicase PcrA
MTGQLALDLPGAEPVVTPPVPELLSPAEVARRCGLSYAPSAEQAAVVAAPVDRPLVVVAGAGSGKTETMAARVAWLVANELVAPEAVLGLTFTRKAASELNARIRLRLAALAAHPASSPGLRERLEVAAPTVATYHGYAATLVAEHGLRIGVEPGSGVLGPAMCWGQAAAVVAAHTGDMSDVQLGLVSTTEDVLQLAGELGEHDVSPAELRQWTQWWERQITGYADAPRKKGAARPAADGRGVRGPQAGGGGHRLRRPGRLRRADRRIPP